MSKLTVTQQLRLQTKLTPAQIQVIKLLELPSCDLQQRINEELQENPALEEGRDPEEVQAEKYEENDFYEEDDYSNPLQNDDFNYDAYVNDDETPDYVARNPNYSADQSSDEIQFAGSTSFSEYLKQQIYLTKMTKPQRHIAKWVLGNIDEDGFLRRTTEQLVDDLAFQEGLTVSDAEMEDIVNQIKEFDPVGVASYDLQECLLKQLKEKPDSPANELAQRILTRCFDAFSRHRFDYVKAKLDVDDDSFKAAVNEILHLNQKPANTFTGNTYESKVSTIIPDFFVENRDGELILTLNTGEISELHVSREYQQMLKEQAQIKSKDNRAAALFLKDKINAAYTFIDAINLRNETLRKTMTAILQRQKEFFLEGDELSLKPMKMQDIADDTGYDISTISRVCNSKYVQTEYGIFPLKHFFSDSMTNAEGEEVSTREIKDKLIEIVAAEDKQNPLTDDALVLLLSEAGFPIARRTIAKYREQLDIPVARLRKQA